VNNTVYLYVFDTMADWEVAYLTAELHSGRYFKKGRDPIKLLTVGSSQNPIVTMGGLRVIPDIKIDECKLEDAAAMLLPGGNTWAEAVHDPIINMVERCLAEGIIVAAICGATIRLAESGLLNQRWHTSNNLDYLKMICPHYSGEYYYKNEPTVTDGNLITASGIAPLEFAQHVLSKLDVFSPPTLDAWYQLYHTQETQYFYALMKSMQ